jgi:hypothetical protein
LAKLIKRNVCIVSYHEHDSILKNKPEEDLCEEEFQGAWFNFPKMREGITQI